MLHQGCCHLSGASEGLHLVLKCLLGGVDSGSAGAWRSLLGSCAQLPCVVTDRCVEGHWFGTQETSVKLLVDPD